MNVGDVIAELQKYQLHKEVRVRIDSLMVDTEIGEEEIAGPGYDVPAVAVVYEGSHVAIEA